MRRRFPFVLAALLVALAAGSSQAETALVAESFTAGAGRPVGTPLNGLATEADGRPWSAATNLVLGSGTATNVAHPWMWAIANVAFEPSLYPGRVARVRARVDPSAVGWDGVGFSSSATGAYWDDGQVWAFLRPDGRLQVLAGGLAHVLFSSPTPAAGFTAGYNTIEVAYQSSTGLVQVWLNGVQQPLAEPDLDAFAFVPAIHYAGFHVHLQGGLQQDGLVRVDDFSLLLDEVPNKASAKTHVIAGYFMWNGSGPNWETDMPRQPALGDVEADGTHVGYDQTAPFNIRRTLQWAQASGIDVMAPIWRGKTGGNWDGTMRARLETFRTTINEPGLPNVEWCVFLGNFVLPRPSVYDFGPPGAPSFHYRQFVDALTVGIDQFGWFSDPKYFKIGGKPVVVLFRTHEFIGDYQSAVDEVRDYWGDQVYLIGMSGRWHLFWSQLDQAAIDRIKPFDAITAWNALAGTPPSPADLGSIADWIAPRYVSWRDQVVQLTVNGKPGTKVDFGPTISCQYDKSPTTGNSSTTRWARNIGDFRALVQAAKSNLDPNGLTGAPGDSFVWLQTLDEWPEGTACQPTELTTAYPNEVVYEDHYGWDFMDVLREEFSPDLRRNPRDPILIAPRDESSTGTTTPTLRWDAVRANPPVVGYQVRVRRADTGAQVFLTDVGNVTAYTMPAGVLAANTRYQWDVRARNTHSNPWSQWSLLDAFQTGGGGTTGGAVASNGTRTDGVSVSWPAVAGATAYRVYRAPEASPTAFAPLPELVTTTSYLDRTGLPGARHYYAASALVGGVETPRGGADLGWRASFNHGVVDLQATQDAFITQEQTSKNWGKVFALRLRHWTSGLARYSFVEFDVPSTAAGVSSATLRLKAQNVALPGVSVFRVDGLNWQETAINWDNWTVGSTATFLYKTWPVDANGYVELDVTDAVDGAGKVTIGLTTDFDFDELDFWARESLNAADRPRLEVVYGN